MYNSHLPSSFCKLCRPRVDTFSLDHGTQALVRVGGSPRQSPSRLKLWSPPCCHLTLGTAIYHNALLEYRAIDYLNRYCGSKVVFIKLFFSVLSPITEELRRSAFHFLCKRPFYDLFRTIIMSRFNLSYSHSGV